MNLLFDSVFEFIQIVINFTLFYVLFNIIIFADVRIRIYVSRGNLISSRKP